MPMSWKITAYRITAVSRFIIGPASSTAMRFQGLAAAKLPGMLGSFSPLRRTKPPKGSQLSEYLVPPASNRVSMRGG